MSKIRNVLADVVVGIVVLLVLWWVLRRVFGFLLWIVSTVAFVAVVIFLLILANRIRGKKRLRL